jgi:phage terminase large subunit
MRETDPDSYRYVWLGDCRPAVKGAVYEREMATAESEGRLTSLQYDPTVPVHTYWDLGWNDTTTVWMVQFIAREVRVIDYYQSNQQTIADDIQALQSRGYVWGTDYLPWDADKSGLKAGKSIRQMAVSLGRKVSIVPQGEVHVGIQAVRMMFPRIWFDAKRCADGLQALRHYRYAEPGKSGTLKREPVHDEASHAADGLRGIAMAATPPAKLPKPPTLREQYGGYYGNMGSGGGGWT